MPKNSMLPSVLVVLLITLIVGYVMLSGSSNAPDVVVDRSYPHHVCTFDRYCAGDTCVDSTQSVVAYLVHEDGAPRLEVPGMSTDATLRETSDRRVFTSTGGDLVGSLTVFSDRSLDFTATEEGEDLGISRHYASGRCQIPHTP